MSDKASDAQPADSTGDPIHQDHASQNRITANVQRKKARHLLTLLQLTAFTVLLIGLAWLYIMQQRQYTEMMQRWQSNAQLTDRINVLEDKLVASTQVVTNEDVNKDDDVSNQSQAQLEQVRLQVQAANILSNNGQIPEAIQLLQGVRWQLKQKNNDIASALTLVLSQSLDKDITMLESLSNQPDSWQAQALTIQAIQKFLYGTIHHDIKDNPTNQADINSTDASMAAVPSLQKAIISPQDAIIYDVLMQLNLAQQAASDKDAAMLQLYLTQAVERLGLIERTPPQRAVTSMNSDAATSSQEKKNTSASQNSNLAQSSSNKNAGSTEQQSNTSHKVLTLNSIADASRLLQQMAQQPPKPITLTTMQVVTTSKADGSQ
ncbi:hypothetical protein [Psychrobacter sp. I-STPA10]|uniref:hypothetical protein n=1 Tax=Psychrobacter sp. I-STPA10 TaxID=2585769 RepID=UPI001E355830|nr:hypothetical protein [Psychrobacter sp. I-STPA10]